MGVWVQTCLDDFDSKAMASAESDKLKKDKKLTREEAERFILERCRPIESNTEKPYWVRFYSAQRNDNHEAMQRIHRIHIDKMTAVFNELMMKMFGKPYVQGVE